MFNRSIRQVMFMCGSQTQTSVEIHFTFAIIVVQKHKIKGYQEICLSTKVMRYLPLSLRICVINKSHFKETMFH